MRKFKEFKTDPSSERLKIYECWPLKAVFTIKPRHSNNILRDAHVGTSIYFKGQANNFFAESKANWLDPQIPQIGLRKKVYGRAKNKLIKMPNIILTNRVWQRILFWETQRTVHRSLLPKPTPLPQKPSRSCGQLMRLWTWLRKLRSNSIR